MTIDLAVHIARLSDERAKLETFLGRHSGWSAWRAAAAEGATEAPHAARRRAEAEADLAGNPVFSAWQALSAAIETLDTIQAQGTGSPHREIMHGMELTASHVARPDDGGGLLEPDGLSTTSEISQARGDHTPPAALAPALPSSVASLPSSLHDAGYSSHSPPRALQAAIIHARPPDAGRSADAMWAPHRPPDDLTRIRRIDRRTAEALTARGIRFFDQIAAFSHADVRTLAAALNLGRRISQENWIEQAAVLGSRAASERARKLAEARTSPLRGVPSSGAEPNLPKGGETAPSLPARDTSPHRDSDGFAGELGSAAPLPLNAPTDTVATVDSAPPAEPPIEPVPAAIALALVIREAAGRIASNATVTGAMAPEPIPDVPVMVSPPSASKVPGEPAPTIAQEDVADITSEHAGSKPEPVPTSMSEPTPVVIDAAAEASPEPIIAHEGASEAATEPVASPPHEQDSSVASAHLNTPLAPATEPVSADDGSARVTTSAAASPAGGTSPEPPPSADDLEMIAGIDTATASVLAGLGITRFSEIASWGPGDVQRVATALGGDHHIGRVNWIEQAAVLARGLETAYARRRHIGDHRSLVPPPMSAPAPDAAFANWLACQTSTLPLAPSDARPPDVEGGAEETAAQPVEVARAPVPGPAEHPTVTSVDSHAPVAPSASVADNLGESAQLDDASAGQAEPETDSGPPKEETGPDDAGHQPAPLAATTAENVPSAVPDLQAERGHRPQPVQPPPLPQSHAADVPGSITARIKALERDLAALEIRPLSPAQPRRVVLPRPTEAAAPATPPVAPPLPDERWQHDALRRVLDPADDDFLGTGPDTISMPEADVTIIRQAAREIGLEPLPKSVALRSVEESASDDFDADAYAAYHGRIEEASVEIVRPAEAVRPPPAAEPPATDGAGPDAGRAEPRPGETVSRFLKALKGS
ncbi:MAG: hypothetical protein JNM89_04875 [Hyphomicrobiaceae bacterium]|nr:hypothetical protein [Hyphomicrobiaceae bacterium]